MPSRDELKSRVCQEIDRRIASRVKGSLKFYDGLSHPGIFSLPKYLRKQIAEEKRVI
jgi:spermidine synthase